MKLLNVTYFSFIRLFAFVLCVFFSSCDFEGFTDKDKKDKESTIDNVNNSNFQNGPCTEAVVIDFFAGQHILIGNVTVQNSQDSLYIQINTTGNWRLGHTHLYVGSLAGIPVNGAGNPQIGNFPYQTAHNPMLSVYSYVLPLDGLDSCFIIAVHAEAHLLNANDSIIQSETAWAAGTQFNTSGSWASYFNYCQTTCVNSTCDAILFPMYGGQTIAVGNLIVTNDSNFLYVTYQLSGNWFLRETHLYVGPQSGLPTNPNNIPVPGQFPYRINHGNNVQSYTYTIPLANLPSCYIIAAHSAVVQVVNGNEQGGETAWSFGTAFPNSPRWGWFSNYCTQICN